MFDQSKVRKIAYSSFQDIQDPDMTKAWSSWKRKKTTDRGKTKLLKIDGQRAINQYSVNSIKPFFGVRPLEVEVVLDTESGELGQFVTWIPALCNIGKMKGWMVDTGNIQEIIRILLFDGAVGNNDRTTVNVLVGTDFRIFAIDEADCFRFKTPVKIRFRKEIRFPIVSYARANVDWLSAFLRCVQANRRRAQTSLLECGADPAIAAEVGRRMQKIKVISDILFAGEDPDAILR